MSQAPRKAGRRRVVIESVTPEIDAGRFPIKRVIGDDVQVEADVFADGHDEICCVLRYCRDGATAWNEVAAQALGNDRWRGVFTVTEVGRYRYTLMAWTDRFATWRNELRRRAEPGDIASALLSGAELVGAAAQRASAEEAERLRKWAQSLLAADTDLQDRLRVALSEDLTQAMTRWPDRSHATVYCRELLVTVDPPRTRYGTWYEMFPRSCAPEGSARHGTLRDCERRLADIAAMGFDVLYLPPIHPIGETARKGRNNTRAASPADVGSPWAIGSAAGGHKSVHPQLGTLADLHALVAAADAHGIAIALDIAFQCSPDHPYVRDHPQWFRKRPDGSIQYAENPPKQYQDIYPFDFETADWQALWEELSSVVSFWAAQGVRIFRVDNPHTKPFALWERLIGETKRAHPEAIFLAEAFTRPKIMRRLAKLGFSQSYTYFAWRNTKHQLTEYFTELAHTEVREYLRASAWPNTPDILTETLQFGGRPAFMARLVLAATLAASYGIYGPAFELLEAAAREPGSEEYLDSEKYQLRDWNVARPDSLREFIARVNSIRRDNPALQQDWNLCFYPVDNDELICYCKTSRDHANVILVVVNLDPHHRQTGWIDLPLADFDLDARQPFQMHDLLSDARYLWHGARNFVELDPASSPAHIFRLRRRVRTERDFDYFL